MRMAMCAIFDQSAQIYGRPIFVRNTQEALRGFMTEIRTPRDGNMLNEHPADFALWHLYDYDDTNGQVTRPDSRNIPILIIDGQSLPKGPK